MSSETPTQKPVLVIVTFPASPTLDKHALRDLLEHTGPKYTRVDGLHRKYFISGEGTGGGVYEWASEPRAKAFYSPQWYARMKQQFGDSPDVTFFDVSAIADGIDHELEIFIEQN